VATRALTNEFQNLKAMSLGEIQVQDDEAGTFCALRIKGPDKFYCTLAIRHNHKLALDFVLQERLTDQFDVRTIVFHEKDGSRPSRFRRLGGFICVGL
jgi:hypothetical protein